MDSTAPRLPVTARVEAEPYAPYAVLAVTAATLAALFGLYLVGRILMAFWGGEPFLQPVVLAAPVAVLVVAYAARRQIATSEGTRAGLPLVNFAWWVAVLGGAGYAAYLVGVQYSIRADAGAAFEKWSGNLAKDLDVNDPKNPAFFRAFDGTLAPNEQDQMRVAEADRIFRESRKLQAIGLRQSDLVRIAARNPGAVEFEAGGLESWEQEAGRIMCKMAIKVRSPEGDFAGSVMMAGLPVDGVRKWQVAVKGNEANIGQFLVTPYGQAVIDLYNSAYQYTNEGFLPLLAGEGLKPYALTELQKPLLKSILLAPATAGRIAVASGAAYPYPEPADYADRIGKLFAPAEKVDAVKEGEQRRAFVAAWRAGKIVAAPRITQSNTDQMSILLFPLGAVEMRYPLEIQSAGSEGSTSACRAALVLRIDDPKFVADLDALRKAGPTAPRSEAVSMPVPVGKVPWRVARIETDMKVMSFDRPGGGGGPGGPGGPPPGGH